MNSLLDEANTGDKKKTLSKYGSWIDKRVSAECSADSHTLSFKRESSAERSDARK